LTQGRVPCKEIAKRMDRRRYRSLFACVVALCVAALTLGDLLRGIHLLAEDHVLCVEHGELVDVTGKSGVSVADGVRSSRSEFAPGQASVDHHAHCALAAAPARTGRAVPPSVVASVAAASHVSVVAIARAEAVRNRSVLADAPKQSPPV
jgi:hypothetical protein